MRRAARSPRRSTAADLETLDFSRLDQVAGPIHVDGAEPGDVLEVELLEFHPADWGWTASIPGFGLLADDFPQAALRITRLADGSRRAAAGRPDPARPVLRRARSCLSGRAAEHDPAHRVGREHGHAPPDGGLAPLAAGDRAGRCVQPGRRPRGPGRRRGLRHRDRDADAGPRAPDRAEGHLGRGAGVRDAGSARVLDEHGRLVRDRRRRAGPVRGRARGHTAG